MKIISTIECEKFRCDWCDKESYRDQKCIVCGKHSCDDCYPSHLIALKFDGPKYFCLTSYTYDIPHMYACPDCEDALTRAVLRLKRITEKWKSAAAKFNKEYNDLAKKVCAESDRRGA